MSTISETLGFNESSFRLLRDLIHQRTGIYFDDGKDDYLVDRIAPRLLENNFNSFIDYYYKLKYEEDEVEWKELINLITINETYFYREFEHIALLRDYIIPEFFKNDLGIPIRIWSAACSTGEEPLSIAMALNEVNYFEKYQIQIFGSDINSVSIQKAKSGLFKERSFRNFPIELKNKYFKQEGKLYRIDPMILNKVDFVVKNLFNFDELQFLYLSNVIFMRNVLIYFSDNAIKKLINFMYERMPKDSYLIVGVSESLLKYRTRFDLIEINNTFVYKKS